MSSASLSDASSTSSPERASGPMLWLTAAPFFSDDKPDWVPAYVGGTAHRFKYVVADYDHDRSRATTSGRQWWDYFGHALKTWFGVSPWKSDVGYITAFPQLPVMLGLIKRLLRSNRPIVAWMFNLGQTYGGAKGVLARFGLGAVDYFIVHSRAEIESYSEWLGLPRERFIFVPLSIRTSSGQHDEDRQDPYIFAMGTANRDYELFFRVAGALSYRTVVVAGEHAVAGLARPSNVTVLSKLSLPECHRLSQGARVNVIPVDNVVTGSGQVTLLETMMYGKAVVATRCAGTVDYVDEGRTALLVPPRDPDAMAEAIRSLWHDPARRQALGAASQDYVKHNVSFAGVAETMRVILDKARR